MKFWRILRRMLLIASLLFVASLIYVRFFPVPVTLYMAQEQRTLGAIKHQWIASEEIPASVMASVIAAEDAGFCDHHGVEWGLLFDAWKEGGNRGASTITQQMVKNVWLWHGESRFSRMLRKVFEIPIAVIVDFFYPKKRIMTLYLNSIEFDTGVFGIQAAAVHHFQKPPSALSAREAALLAAVLPNPKGYSAVPPSSYVNKRAQQIEIGAADVAIRGLDDCVE